MDHSDIKFPKFSPQEVKKLVIVFWLLGIALVLFGALQGYNLWEDLFKNKKVVGQVYISNDPGQVLNTSFIVEGKTIYVDVFCYGGYKSERGAFLGFSPDCRSYPKGSEIVLYYPENEVNKAKYIRADSRFTISLTSFLGGLVLLFLLFKRQKSLVKINLGGG